MTKAAPTSTVAVADVRKPPDGAQAHCVANAGKEKVIPASPHFPLFQLGQSDTDATNHLSYSVLSALHF